MKAAHMAKRGRPHGSIVRLLKDSGRFEVAAWFAFTELGLAVYPAARLTTFLIASDRPITTESIDGVLLKSTTTHRTTVTGHADRVRRKAPDAIARADDRERAWLVSSSALIIAVVEFLASGNEGGLKLAIEQLREAGWTETLDRVAKRIDASLRSNFPPAESPLRGAAARLLLARKSAA